VCDDRGGVCLDGNFIKKMRKIFKIRFVLSVNSINKGGHNDQQYGLIA
jgi:hypothetical protein